MRRIISAKYLIILLIFALICYLLTNIVSVSNGDEYQPLNQSYFNYKVGKIVELVQQAYAEVNSSLHYYDRKSEMAVMRLSGRESDAKYRSDEARIWLRSQRLIVAATVRDAKSGLQKSLNEAMRVANLFKSVIFVFVENDSKDGTRKFLNQFRSQHPNKVFVLGCGINSILPCQLKLKYANTNHLHKTSVKEAAGRTEQEESIDRGILMSGIRNLYLKFIYENHLPGDLLLVIDADLPFRSINQDNILQGLFYFKAKPNLSSLCAAVSYDVHLHDPCTLIFYHNKYFYVDAPRVGGLFIDRIMDYIMYRGTKLYPNQLPQLPLKVAACFQGFAFYRLSEMREKNVLYRQADGEWQCEHTSLSKQLSENYYDTKMRIVI